MRSPTSEVATLDALLAEQHDAWARGAPEPVETWLARHALSDDDALDLIYHEMVLREAAGEALDVEDLVRRFPSREGELRRHVALHRLMADVGDAEGPPDVPGYDIVAPLGRGGMGVVYEARQRSLDRTVALKVLPRAAASDPEALMRFEREARAASSLNHPNLCTIHDFGQVDGRPFIAMEKIEGSTLDLIDSSWRAPASLRRIVQAVAQGVAAAHARGVVHRDLKPDNVMLRADGLVKVLDFGLAQLAHGAHARPTSPGTVVGTLRYMSPEQLRGDPVAASTDVFSLGVMWYEALTGAHPFAAGWAAGPLEAATADLHAKLSAADASLLTRMLAPDPAARPTMDAVATALAVTSESALPTVAPRPRRARRGWLVAIGLGALAALAIGIAASALVPSAEASALPSIVVMTFTPTGGPDESYLGAGVADDLTAMLARSPDIRVLARSAVTGREGAALAARDLGRELGVDYVLEGSVQKGAERLRIISQLVDARTGVDVWSERFDTSGDDPWSLQDAIAGRIVTALSGDLGQIRRMQYRVAWGRDTAKLQEYDYFLRGHELYLRFTREDNERAGAIWREGLVRYPESALLQSKLGWYHLMRPYMYYVGDAQDYDRAHALAESALAHAAMAPLERRFSHWLAAYLAAQRGDYDRALREAATAESMSPHEAFVHGDLATVHIFAGRTDEAIARARDAAQRDPSNRAFYEQLEGWALSVAGRHDASRDVLRRGLALPSVPFLQAINCVHLDRDDEARAEIARGLAIVPRMSRARWRAANFYRDERVLADQLDALARAGLAE